MRSPEPKLARDSLEKVMTDQTSSPLFNFNLPSQMKAKVRKTEEELLTESFRKTAEAAQ